MGLIQLQALRCIGADMTPVQIGVKTLSWMDWKSAVNGAGALDPEPIGLPLASNPTPLPAQPLSSAAAVISVAVTRTNTDLYD